MAKVTIEILPVTDGYDFGDAKEPVEFTVCHEAGTVLLSCGGQDVIFNIECIKELAKLLQEKVMDDIDRNKFNLMRNEHNAMSLRLEEVEDESKLRKVTIDKLSAELSKFKRKQKRASNAQLDTNTG